MIIPAPFGKDDAALFNWAQALVLWLDRKFGIGSQSSVGGASGPDADSLYPGITGEVKLWSGSAAPTGWGECAGQVFKIAAQPGLFRVWGTRWNTGGEAADEFRAPDGRGRLPMGYDGTLYGGAETATIAKANLPALSLPVTDPGHDHALTMAPHTHTINDPGHVHTVGNALAPGGMVSVSSGAVSVPVGASTTLSAASHTTGVTAANTTATGTIASHATGISVALDGGGTPLPILPPFIGYMQIFKF